MTSRFSAYMSSPESDGEFCDGGTPTETRTLGRPVPKLAATPAAPLPLPSADGLARSNSDPSLAGGQVNELGSLPPSDQTHQQTPVNYNKVSFF